MESKRVPSRMERLSQVARAGALQVVAKALPSWKPAARKAHAERLGLDPPSYEVTVTGIDTVEVAGNMLRGSLLLPRGASWPLPVVLMRTPYGRNNEFGQTILAERGFAVLVQDTRGRFSSDGDFIPVQNEIEDGQATVEWIHKQPWCNGKVGLTGISYLGFTAWAACQGGGVSVIMPVVTQSRVKSAMFLPGGAFSVELVLLWLHLVIHLMADLEHDPSSFVRKFLGALWKQPLQKAFRHLPLTDVDKMLLGKEHDFFQEGIQSESNPESTFWDDKDVLFDFEGEVPPCNFITGWYDFFLEECLRDFSRAKVKQKDVRITIAAMSHWGIGLKQKLYSKTLLNVLSEHLKGEIPARVAFNTHPVQVQLLGTNVWRGFDIWPPPFVLSCWWLSSNPGELLQSQPSARWTDEYVFDPNKPTPSFGGPSFDPFNGGARYQNRLEQRADVLVYTSTVLPADVTVIGRVVLHLRCSHSAHSTDFLGRLCEVDAAGKSVNRCEGLQRVTGEANTAKSLDIDLGHVAACFRRGQRIRLQVCSGAHPRWMRNLGTGEQIATATRTLPSNNCVFQGSHLSLPLELPASPL